MVNPLIRPLFNEFRRGEIQRVWSGFTSPRLGWRSTHDEVEKRFSWRVGRLKVVEVALEETGSKDGCQN